MVTRNKTETILILLACYCFIICILLYSLSTSAPPLLFGSRVFHTPYPGSTFKSPGVCNGSDLVLCTVDCGLRATSVLMFFDSALQSISGGRCTIIFRLDALALSVIATATCLGGWVAGRLSHSGIVSKPLNLSENFFDHLKAPSL